MKEAYVIMGDSGAYSDYAAWPVRVFLDRAEADTFLVALGVAKAEAYKEYRALLGARKPGPGPYPLFSNPLDPGGDWEVTYTIRTLPLGAA